MRPRVIVWLAVEDARGRKSYVDSISPAATAIDGPARERGMPFILPLLDIEDRMTLPVSTLWGGFPEPIQRASRRYAADAVLAGRAWQGDTGSWKARWTLFGELAREFRTSGESLETAIAEGMHEAADRFAARFARRGAAAAASRVPLAVTGVERLEDYARALHYLASIDIVESVQVERVEPSRVRFVVHVRGGRPALAELIALGRTLGPRGRRGRRRGIRARLPASMSRRGLREPRTSGAGGPPRGSGRSLAIRPAPGSSVRRDDRHGTPASAPPRPGRPAATTGAAFRASLAPAPGERLR